MLRCLNVPRPIRMIATGICFLTFICSGVILTVTALPAILLFSATPEQRETRTMSLLRSSFKLFLKYMILLSPSKAFEVQGVDYLTKVGSCIFIANHPTLIDVIGVISYLPLCQCIVKKSLLEHLYLGGLMRAAGYIANDHASQLIDHCRRSLTAGRSLLIFPEGTRSPAHRLGSFTRGAAQIALRTGAPIVPVVITCEPSTLLKGEAWYEVPESAFRMAFRFYPPMEIPQTVWDQSGFPLQVRALNRHLEDFFHHQLQETDPQYISQV